MKYLTRKCKYYKISLSFSNTCLHTLQTVTLTKYYRNIVNMVNGIVKSCLCIKHLNKL